MLFVYHLYWASALCWEVPQLMQASYYCWPHGSVQWQPAAALCCSGCVLQLVGWPAAASCCPGFVPQLAGWPAAALALCCSVQQEQAAWPEGCLVLLLSLLRAEGLRHSLALPLLLLLAQEPLLL